MRVSGQMARAKARWARSRALQHTAKRRQPGMGDAGVTLFILGPIIAMAALTVLGSRGAAKNREWKV